MASTEIRVNLLFEDNISAVTRRIGSLTKAINRLNSALGQLKSNDKATIRVELEGAESVLKGLREINRMLNRLKNNQEVRIRLTLDERAVQRAQKTVINNVEKAISMRFQQSWQHSIKMQQTLRVINQNYVAVVNTGEQHKGNIFINQGRINYRQSPGIRGEKERSFAGEDVGRLFTGAANFGVSYAIAGIRLLGFQLPKMVVGTAANYFKTLVDYQKRAFVWMTNTAKQGIDFLRNNIIEGLKRGVQVVANVGRFLIQVPFKYIGSALIRGVTGFYSGAIKLFTGMLQAPFKVLRTARNIFNEIDRWFRHVSQAFYYVSMTASYISRTAGLIAGVLIGFITKVFESFKTAVQSQYRIAVTTGIVTTPTSVTALQGDYSADIRNKITMLTKVAYQINQRTGAAFNDVVSLLYFISSSGFKQTEELKNVTEAVSSIAFATGSDPVALFRSLISVIGAEGIAPTEKNLGTALAKIVYAVSEGVFEMGELATQLQRVASFSEAANTSFEETLSIMAALSKGGLKPEMIGTGLSQVFVQLNRPQVQEKMRQRMGIVPIKFEQGIMQQQSIMEIIEAMIPSDLLRRVRSGELTPADREMLKQIAKQSAIMLGFEKRAQTAWLTLFNKLDDVYRMLREFEGMARVPGLLEKYLTYFKEIPNSTMLATLNRISGALEYLKTTVLNALMNKLGANIETIEKWFRQVADKIATLIESGKVLQRIVELVKSVIKLIINLIRVAIIFGTIATAIRLMAAFFEMIRPNILLLFGFVRGFINALAKQGKGDLSKLVESYVEMMLIVGEKLGEFFAKLFEVIENFITNVNKYKELTGSSGEAVGQATAELVVNLSGVLADATGAAAKWVNDFTRAFITEFKKKEKELRDNITAILLNIFSFNLNFFNIALHLVQAFFEGLSQSMRIMWTVTKMVPQVDKARKKAGKKQLSDLSFEDKEAINEYIDDLTSVVLRNIEGAQDDERLRNAVVNLVTSYVNLMIELPQTLKRTIEAAFDAAIYGLDVGLKLLNKILDGIIRGLSDIVDKVMSGGYAEILADLESDSAQFVTKIGQIFIDIAIAGFQIGSYIMSGAAQGVANLSEWFEKNAVRRKQLGEAIKNFFISSMKFAVESVNFAFEILNVVIPAINKGIDELIAYITNPQRSKQAKENFEQLITNLAVFMGKTVKLLLVVMPGAIEAIDEALKSQEIDKVWDEIITSWQKVSDTLNSRLPSIVASITDLITSALRIVNEAFDSFNKALRANHGNLVQLYDELYSMMLNIAGNYAIHFSASAEALSKKTKEALEPGTEAYEKLESILTSIKNAVASISGAVGDAYAIAIKYADSIAQGLIDGLEKADVNKFKREFESAFNNFIRAIIRVTSFNADIGTYLLGKLYEALYAGLKLWNILTDEKAWKEFTEGKNKLELTIPVAYEFDKTQTLKFKESDIDSLKKIKQAMGQFEIIAPKLTLSVTAWTSKVLLSINQAVSNFMRAVSLFDPFASYEKQSEMFRRFIGKEDWDLFEQTVNNLSQSLAMMLENMFLRAPIVISKLLLKVRMLKIQDFENSGNVLGLMWESLKSTLTTLVSGTAIGFVFGGVPGAIVGLTLASLLEIYLNGVILGQIANDFFNQLVNILRNVFLVAFGAAFIGLWLFGPMGGLIGLTLGVAVGFVFNFDNAIEKAREETRKQLEKIRTTVDITTGKMVQVSNAPQVIDIAKKVGVEKYIERIQKDITNLAQQLSALYKGGSTYLKSDQGKPFLENVVKFGLDEKKRGEFVKLAREQLIAYDEKKGTYSGKLYNKLYQSLLNIANTAGHNQNKAFNEFITDLQNSVSLIAMQVLAQGISESWDKASKDAKDNTQLQTKFRDYLTRFMADEFKVRVHKMIGQLRMGLSEQIMLGGKAYVLFNDNVPIEIRNAISAALSRLGLAYAEGGYTGDGGKYEPAGIVHKGEYVIPQWMVKKYPDTVAALEKIRKRGYQKGGAVEFTVPLSNKSGQKTILDAFFDLSESIGKVASTISKVSDGFDIDAVVRMLDEQVTAKDIARGFGAVSGILLQTSKDVVELMRDGFNGLREISGDIDEIKRQIFGIREEVQKAAEIIKVTTKVTAEGKKQTEVTGNVKEILINSLASVFLGQEAGFVFGSFILPLLKDLRGKEFTHRLETQDEILEYKFADYGIPLLGEITDILLSFGNWADKLVSDETLRKYRSIYIYPTMPGGIAGGEGEFKSIGDKLIDFLNRLQNIKPFEMFENIPLIGNYFAAVNNIFETLGQRMPGIVKNLITFVGSLESVQRAFSPINEIIKAATEVLTPFINDAMQPLIEVWQMIGRYIGMTLIPIVQIFGALLKVLMVIFEPVVDAFRLVGKVIFIIGKVILMVFTKVANAIIDVFNFVIGVINSVLGWLGIRLSTLRKLQEETFEDILRQAEELFASTTLGASSGGSGGVGVTSRAENITYNNYITVNFEDMVIADKEKFKEFLIETLQELGLSVGK